MHDRFRSDQRIAKVTAPVLVMHGARDTIIPISYGERLYALITSPKKFGASATDTTAISMSTARRRRCAISSRRNDSHTSCPALCRASTS
jgi:hypothetical protein